MAGHNTLEATDSVILSTGGRPVLKDRSCCQFISAVKSILTRFPGMSESSCAPNNFLVPAAWKTPLRPTCDGDVPMHSNKQLNSRCHRDARVVTPLPLHVVEYLKWETTRFVVGRFCRMRPDGVELQWRDRLCAHRDLAVTGWT